MDPLLKPQPAADYISRARQTLAEWRMAGIGPDYIRQGRAIFYRQSALDAWLELGTVKGGVRHGSKAGGPAGTNNRRKVSA